MLYYNYENQKTNLGVWIIIENGKSSQQLIKESNFRLVFHIAIPVVLGENLAGGIGSIRVLGTHLLEPLKNILMKCLAHTIGIIALKNAVKSYGIFKI